jgi:SAM-dependent methyltransferase
VAFPDATFDLVVLIGVSEWLVSLAQPLREIFRVLKPGGRLIISADNNWPLHQILDPVFNPALKPLKSRVGRLLQAAGLRTRRPRFHAYSLGDFDRVTGECRLRQDRRSDAWVRSLHVLHPPPTERACGVEGASPAAEARGPTYPAAAISRIGLPRSREKGVRFFSDPCIHRPAPIRTSLCITMT